MFNKLKTKFLERSGSYNHYKKEHEILTKDLNKKINELSKENKKLTKRVKETEKILDSYNLLFENIYLNHELKPTRLWKQVQSLEQELLTFFDNICVKYDIGYWLDYGTLIGAVRHKGFIPWDDDIDLGIMRKDFEKLYPCLNKEIKRNNLDNDIYPKIYHRTSRGSVLGFIQFTYRYPTFGITMSNIDVFPYDFRKSSEGITDTMYYQERDALRKKLREDVEPAIVVEEFMNNLDLTYDESDYIIPGPEAERGINQLKYHMYDKDTVFPLRDIEFMDGVYKSPNNPDEFLRAIYGDYTRIPKKVDHHGLLQLLKTKDDIEDQFDIAIEKLAMINENFFD